MTMTTVTVRVDSETKKAAASIYERVGLDLSTAIRVFLRQTVNHNQVPFDLSPEAPYVLSTAELLRRKADIDEGRYLVVKSMDELEAMARD